MKLIMRPHLTVSVTQKSLRGNYQLLCEMYTDKSPWTYDAVTFNGAKAIVFQEELY